MAGVSETRTIDALLTTTLANYRNKLVDNIFDTYPLLSWLNGKLGVALRGESVKRVVGGGESIVEQLMYEVNNTAKSYAGAEVLDTTLQDGMTNARYNWKQYSASVGITGLERRSNMSEEQLINLLDAKTKQAEKSLQKSLSEGAWSDGTGNGGKDLTGLQALVDSTTTVGGLAPGTFAWWAADEAATVGSFAANGITQMRTSFNNVSYGNDKPDIIFTDQNNFERYEAALQPQERYVNTKAADAGFQNLTFKGVPIMWDRDCPSNEMYFLNSNYMNLVVHRDADMATGEFIRPENQDVTTAQILFQGNLTLNNRRMFAKMTGLTA
jgi:hypothetical protein